MMDCLYAECTPCITDCVLAELEKLGQKYRVALKVAKVRTFSHVSTTVTRRNDSEALPWPEEDCKHNLVH